VRIRALYIVIDSARFSYSTLYLCGLIISLLGRFLRWHVIGDTDIAVDRLGGEEEGTAGERRKRVSIDGTGEGEGSGDKSKSVNRDDIQSFGKGKNRGDRGEKKKEITLLVLAVYI